jgi:hypothetical protein
MGWAIESNRGVGPPHSPLEGTDDWADRGWDKRRKQDHHLLGALRSPTSELDLREEQTPFDTDQSRDRMNVHILIFYNGTGNIASSSNASATVRSPSRQRRQCPGQVWA